MRRYALYMLLFGAYLGGVASPASCWEYDACPAVPCDWPLCDGTAKLSGDWLFWKIQQDNLHFDSLEIGESIGSEVFTGHTARPKYKYDSGFRINLGYELPGQQWDLTASYTYLPTSAQSDAFIFPLFGSQVSSSQKVGLDTSKKQTLFDQASPNPTQSLSFAGKWLTHISNIDLDIARSITFGEWFTLRPHMGLRACWIDQKYHLRIEDIQVRLHEQFEGIGAEGGMWMGWNWNCGLSLLGHLGGSILYSNSCLKERADVIPFLTVTGKDRIWDATPTFDSFIGLQYETTLYCFALEACIGWEQHILFDVNHFARHGNLTAQGLTLDFGIAY